MDHFDHFSRQGATQTVYYVDVCGRGPAMPYSRDKGSRYVSSILDAEKSKYKYDEFERTTYHYCHVTYICNYVTRVRVRDDLEGSQNDGDVRGATRTFASDRTNSYAVNGGKNSAGN